MRYSLAALVMLLLLLCDTRTPIVALDKLQTTLLQTDDGPERAALKRCYDRLWDQAQEQVDVNMAASKPLVTDSCAHGKKRGSRGG